MAYVLYDKRMSMYVSRAKKKGFDYTNDLNNAQVYKSKGGAINAVGEPDKSFNAAGKWPPSKKKTVPDHMAILSLSMEERGEEAKPSITDKYKLK